MRLLPPVALGLVLLLSACPTLDEGAPEVPLPDLAADLVIEPLSPSDGPLGDYFSKHITVFGIDIVATETTPDDKVLHAAHVMAQYLDNDEDGEVDQPDVVEEMLSAQALLVMFETQEEIEDSGIFEDDALDGYWGQDLYADETDPSGDHFDASLEEVLHLISTAGYAQVWPDSLGTEPGTDLAEAMDIARGGHFDGVPSSYPEEAWYHYDDTTCDYDCQAVEYFYWGLTSLLGAQAYRCDEIAVEWEPCTPELVESMDAALYDLLVDPGFGLPTVLPDGSYGG